jgi:hypothetical protein
MNTPNGDDLGLAEHSTVTVDTERNRRIRKPFDESATPLSIGINDVDAIPRLQPTS